MANYIGIARSNYVRIKDMEGLEKALAPFAIEMQPEHPDKPTCIGFFDDSCGDGGWPSWAEDDDGNELEFDPAKYICPYMEDGEILVMQEVGYEKRRYLSGVAVAYNSKGEQVAVSLEDIYRKAAEAWDKDVTAISHASY